MNTELSGDDITVLPFWVNAISPLLVTIRLQELLSFILSVAPPLFIHTVADSNSVTVMFTCTTSGIMILHNTYFVNTVFANRTNEIIGISKSIVSELTNNVPSVLFSK